MLYKKILKIAGIVLLSIMGVLLVVDAYISWQISDKKLAGTLRDVVSSTLGTRVELDGISVSVTTSSMAVYNLTVYDKQDKAMLHVDTLRTSVNVFALLRHQIHVRDFYLSGAKGTFYQQNEDSDPNYQFALDSLNLLKSTKASQIKKKKSNKFSVKMSKLRIQRSGMKYDILADEPLNTPQHQEIDMSHLWVDHLNLRLRCEGEQSWDTFSGLVETLSVDELNSKTKIEFNKIKFDGAKRRMELKKAYFKYQFRNLTVSNLVCFQKGEQQRLEIGNMHLHADNGQPLKTIGHPNRGRFDIGHLDVDITLKANATSLKQDSMVMQLEYLQANDTVSTLGVDSLHARFFLTRRQVVFTDLDFKYAHSRAHINRFILHQPDYEQEGDDAKATFEVDKLTGHVILQDIAAAFAPPLRNFTTPLNVRTSVKGKGRQIQFINTYAYSDDKRVEVRADGVLNLPPRRKPGEAKKRATLAFQIHSLSTRNGIKEQLLGHFAKFPPRFKQLMVNAGTLTYSGRLGIPYKRLKVDGVFGTTLGKFKTHAYLNSDKSYLTASVEGEDIDLTPLGASDRIGPLSIKADIDMEILKASERKRRGYKKGKLPNGTIKGVVLQAQYGKLKVRNIEFEVENTEKKGSGSFTAERSYAELSADFTFDDSNIKKSLKVKPHVKFHLGKKKDKDEDEEEETTTKETQKESHKSTLREREKEQGTDLIPDDTTKVKKKHKSIFRKRKKKKSSTED